jgi:FkbM family methyltransferase
MAAAVTPVWKTFWNKPFYIFRPSQIWTRLKIGLNPTGIKEVTLPWGVRIDVEAGETIGRAILLNGVFDLSISETLWRLLEPGEIAVDAGANIGYMTSILAVRTGARGCVYAFEPNPRVFPRLLKNITTWASLPQMGRIISSTEALSNHSGEMLLHLPISFEVNQGLATLHPAVLQGGTRQSFPVALTTLDENLAQERQIGVLKIDVEGHELAVLQGASTLLKEHRIRDIVFESHLGYPTAVTDLLESHGYHLYQLTRSFWRVELRSPLEIMDPARVDESPNYLATLEPERAEQRMRRKGWTVLGWSCQIKP